MVRTDIVTHKLGELADRVERVRTHQRSSPAALLADRDALDVVAFNLMLAVQASADLAAHIIADEGWRPVASLAESSGSEPRRLEGAPHADAAKRCAMSTAQRSAGR